MIMNIFSNKIDIIIRFISLVNLIYPIKNTINAKDCETCCKNNKLNL